MTTLHNFSTKIAFTLALAACAYLLSEDANAQSPNSPPLLRAELSIASGEKLTLQMRKDTLKQLKEQNKQLKLSEKLAKESRKLEKINAQIDKLCAKPALAQSSQCKNPPVM